MTHRARSFVVSWIQPPHSIQATSTLLQPSPSGTLIELRTFFVSKDYNLIVLSGIVQQGGKSIKAKLTVGFQFHLPYLTKDGSQTSLMIATGPHVTVNTIVGPPFIQAT